MRVSKDLHVSELVTTRCTRTLTVNNVHLVIDHSIQITHIHTHTHTYQSLVEPHLRYFLSPLSHLFAFVAVLLHRWETVVVGSRAHWCWQERGRGLEGTEGVWSHQGAPHIPKEKVTVTE